MRFTILFLLLGGCAHVVPQGQDPRRALEQVCVVGATNRAVQGSIWMTATSKEASGRFPAQVRAIAANGKTPSSLKLEATNPLGGVEAVITIEGKKYAVEIPEHPERAQKGSQTWAGIPLEWATDLFLGRVPCPEAVALPDAKLSLSPEGELTVVAPATLSGDAQKFVYRLKYFGDQAWPDQLHWEKQGYAPASVDFHFYEPEDHTRSPTRWEAKSPKGEVKVRWKDRDVH